MQFAFGSKEMKNHMHSRNLAKLGAVFHTNWTSVLIAFEGQHDLTEDLKQAEETYDTIKDLCL
jgi:hypothetical protein